MAPRSSWKGFIRLSLVSVPVRGFTANNTGEEIRLNQLHEECKARVKYQKICPEHGELRSDQIVSGYEFAKGQYVLIEPNELNKLRTESDRSIAIEGFVDPAEVDSMYFAGKSYYLLPDGMAGERPYSLLRRGMDEESMVAVGQVVISGREQLVLLRPVENLILMQILAYPKKVRSVDQFQGEFEEPETSEEEMGLTRTLMEASKLEEFDLGTYRDEYTQKLSRLIQLKIDGEEIVQPEEPEEPKIINLMDALKKSVAEAQAASGRRMAPSVKKSGDKKKSSGRRKKSG